MVSQSTFPGTYSAPFTRDYSRFQRLITKQTCEKLQEHGYVVLDDCFGHGWANALLDEMKWLHAQNYFAPNKTQFAMTQNNNASQVVQFVKPNIYEVDLHDAHLRTKVPELDALFHSTELLQIFSEHMPEYDLQFSTSGRTLKLQRNAGNGGCFPCHYDNPGKPNRRKLTCLLYLNDKWTKGDGGEVQLTPFLQAPVTVAPKMDRMVIFMSDWMLHRVLPSRAERYCLTIWLDGGAETVNTVAHTQLRITPQDMADWFGFLDRLRKSPVQRLLSRGVYEEEYYESLTQCMQSAREGLVEMLKSHETHIETLKRNAPLYNFITRLRHVREMTSETPICID
uniref:Fe2OG dioxygenase domain-containing protein n=1 Tax=Globisporangium ultimum (strain ATCC 200006 / CBS 805.95 / DAOM BR144) TaxID=431595 RepID=K3X985_GLOUD